MSNRRAIVWLLLAVFALVAIHVLLSLNGATRPEVAARTSLIDFPDEAVSMLVIKRTGSADAVITRAGSWRLIEPFAASVDEQTVLRLLDTLAFAPIDDRLSDQELLKLGRTRKDFGLVSPWLSVRVRAGEEESGIAFGALTPSASGVYASLEGVNAVFVVPSNVLEAVDVPVTGFRRRTLFTVGSETVSSFDVKRGGNSFLRFRRDGDVWTMMQPVESPASAVRIRKLLDGVMSAEAADFVWPVGATNEVASVSAALLSGYGLDPESAVTLTFKCTDGVDRRISLGAEADEGFVYALVHNDTAIVTLDRALKDEATAETSLFADTRLFPYEALQVAGISLAYPDVTCLLAKEEDGSWRMDSPVSAPASRTAVTALLTRLLSLRSADAADRGVAVSLAADAAPVTVSKDALGEDFRIESLRDTGMLIVDPLTVKRLTATGADGAKPTSVLYDGDRRLWNVESSPVSGTASQKAVESILSEINPLSAVRVEKLKVSADDLRDYGLETPRLTLAVDLNREDAVRRNILIGDRTKDGYFATIGAADAVFVLPERTVKILSAPLVEE